MTKPGLHDSTGVVQFKLFVLMAADTFRRSWWIYLIGLILFSNDQIIVHTFNYITVHFLVLLNFKHTGATTAKQGETIAATWLQGSCLGPTPTSTSFSPMERWRAHQLLPHKQAEVVICHIWVCQWRIWRVLTKSELQLLKGIYSLEHCQTKLFLTPLNQFIYSHGDSPGSQSLHLRRLTWRLISLDLPMHHAVCIDQADLLFPIFRMEKQKLPTIQAPQVTGRYAPYQPCARAGAILKRPWTHSWEAVPQGVASSHGVNIRQPKKL